MNAKANIQLLAKSIFLGSFFGMCLGLFEGGGVVPGISWPRSNLGPMMGAIYGIPSGAIVAGGIWLCFWRCADLALQSPRGTTYKCSGEENMKALPPEGDATTQRDFAQSPLGMRGRLFRSVATFRGGRSPM